MRHLAMEGCHCYTRFITTSIAISLAFLMLGPQVDAIATLELLMVSFSNPTSRDAGGGFCDEIFTFHVSACDHIFQFSLDLGNSNDNPRGSHYWSRTTGHFQDQNDIDFGHDMAGVENPIVTPFDAWPSIGVKFKVFVTEHDTVTDHDTVDGFVYLLQVTPAPNVSVADWTPVKMRGIRNQHRTSFTMKHKLYCNANYYTSDCSVHCVASDTDAGGHYTCDPITGNIVCRPGWESESTRCRTLSNDCLNNACENGATCVDGVRAYICLCPPGYTGTHCETDIDECASNPCQQGATCEDQVNGFTCRCPPGFAGELCSNVYQSTSTIIDSSVTPRRSKVIVSNTGISSEPWLYVLICAICLILLGVLVLIALLWTRRRKRANMSENRPPTVPECSSVSSSLPPPSTLPPSYTAAAAETSATAGFCVITDSVDMRGYGRRFSREKLIVNSGKDEESPYDTIGNEPAATSQETSSLPPEKASAAAGGFTAVDRVPSYVQSNTKL